MGKYLSGFTIKNLGEEEYQKPLSDFLFFISKVYTITFTYRIFEKFRFISIQKVD